MAIRARGSMGGVRSGDRTHTDPELHALLDRVATRDEEAFAELYDAIVHPILGIVTSVLRDHARAEEVTQEVLLEIWMKAPQFCHQHGNVMAWAITMAHRRAIDRVRHDQAAIDREIRVGQLNVRRPVDAVVETIMAQQEIRDVRRALGELSELQRQSIVLAYYEGYTYREVSEVLATPVGTVKTRMRDGLIRLRNCLGAHPN